MDSDRYGDREYGGGRGPLFKFNTCRSDRKCKVCKQYTYLGQGRCLDETCVRNMVHYRRGVRRRDRRDRREDNPEDAYRPNEDDNDGWQPPRDWSRPPRSWWETEQLEDGWRPCDSQGGVDYDDDFRRSPAPSPKRDRIPRTPERYVPQASNRTFAPDADGVTEPARDTLDIKSTDADGVTEPAPCANASKDAPMPMETNASKRTCHMDVNSDANDHGLTRPTKIVKDSSDPCISKQKSRVAEIPSNGILC